MIAVLLSASGTFLIPAHVLLARTDAGFLAIKSMNITVGTSASESIYRRSILPYFSGNRRSGHSQLFSCSGKGNALGNPCLKNDTFIKIETMIRCHRQVLQFYRLMAVMADALMVKEDPVQI